MGEPNSSNPLRFRKRPVVIEAVRWSGYENHISRVLDLFAGDIPRAPDDPHIWPGLGYTPADGSLYIPTLEGTMCAKPGDWIIKGVAGEVYPCKPDIFEQTYEPVLESANESPNPPRGRRGYATSPVGRD